MITCVYWSVNSFLSDIRWSNFWQIRTSFILSIDALVRTLNELMTENLLYDLLVTVILPQVIRMVTEDALIKEWKFTCLLHHIIINGSGINSDDFRILSLDYFKRLFIHSVIILIIGWLLLVCHRGSLVVEGIYLFSMNDLLILSFKHKL